MALAYPRSMIAGCLRIARVGCPGFHALRTQGKIPTRMTRIGLMTRHHGTAALLLSVALAAAPPAVARAQDGASRMGVTAAPMTTAPLAPFPYLSWPSEFAPQNTPVVRSLGHFPFWTGKALHDVEGQTFLVTLVSAGGGDFNEYLIKKVIQTQLTGAGAVRITASRVPSQVLQSIPEVDRQSLEAGMGDPYNSPVETWLIRRPDREIWIQYNDNSAQASLAVVETSPQNPTGDTAR